MDRPIEMGMLTVDEAVALRDELLELRRTRRRHQGHHRGTPLIDRLINTLIIRIAEVTGVMATSEETLSAARVREILAADRAAREAETQGGAA